MILFHFILLLFDRELGKKMREEQDEKRRLQEEGFKKREGFIAEANNMMEGKKVP